MRDHDELRKEIEHAIAVKRVTNRQIEADTGLSHNTVNRFLGNRGPVQRGTIIRLAAYLGVNWREEKTAAGR